jgi:hypothetical protein
MAAPVVAPNSLLLVVANQFSRVVGQFTSNIARCMTTKAVSLMPDATVCPAGLRFRSLW